MREVDHALFCHILNIEFKWKYLLYLVSIPLFDLSCLHKSTHCNEGLLISIFCIIMNILCFGELLNKKWT